MSCPYKKDGVEALSLILEGKKNYIILFDRKVRKCSTNEDDYKFKMMQIIYDLEKEKESISKLQSRLLDNSFSDEKLEEILKDSIKQMPPQIRKIYNQELGFSHHTWSLVVKIDNNKSSIKNIEEGETMCFNCKSFHVRTFTRQTRSGDEGMITFNTCSNCGKNWRS